MGGIKATAFGKGLTAEFLRKIETKELLTTTEAAILCGVGQRSVQLWCDRGKLPHYRLPSSGRDRRIYKRDLIAFMTEHGMDASRIRYRPGTSVMLVGIEEGLAGKIQDETIGPNVRFRVAGNAFTAGLELSRDSDIDVLVVDSWLGSEACAQIREAAVSPVTDCRALLLVGEDEPRPGAFATKCGYDNWLKKPVDVRAVISLAFQGAKR